MNSSNQSFHPFSGGIEDVVGKNMDKYFMPEKIKNTIFYDQSNNLIMSFLLYLLACIYQMDKAMAEIHPEFLLSIHDWKMIL